MAIVLNFNPAHDKAGKFAPSGASSSLEFAANADAKSFLDEHYGNWRKALTPKEDKGLTFYQSPGYELMNGALRGRTINAPAKDLARAKDAVAGLDSAIKKAPPLKQSMTVYRGFSAGQFELKSGAVISDAGFVSTALTKEQAGSFVSQGKQAMAKITLPKGTVAAGGSVKELILPRGSKFRIVSVSSKGRVVDVEMELLR